jgi:hypothetical protein
MNHQTLKSPVKQIFGAVALGFTISFAMAATVIGISLIRTEQRARESIGFSPITHLSELHRTAPVLSQASIDRAVEMFQIRIPEHVNGPTFDPSLADRGLTMKRGVLGKVSVTIGPDAFSSWPLLGSTIAHEVEVHCRQSFVAIHLMDIAGLDGTGIAEREAYAYEIKYAQRFGLTPYDMDLIKSTSSYYYPKQSFTFTDIPSVKLFVTKLSRLAPNKASEL